METANVEEGEREREVLLHQAETVETPVASNLGYFIGVILVMAIAGVVVWKTRGGEHVDVLSSTPQVPYLPDLAHPFHAQVYLHDSGDATPQSPVSWVAGEGLSTGAFARWAVPNAKCLAVRWQEEVDQAVVLKGCGSSHDILLFNRIGHNFTIRPMADPSLCFTAKSGKLVLSRCAGVLEQQFLLENKAGAEVHLEIKAVGSRDCLVAMPSPDTVPADASPSPPDRFTLNSTGDHSGGEGEEILLGDCSLDAVYGLLSKYDEREMTLNLTPQVKNNKHFRLGETYMGSPGVHLPWDAVPKHIVEYPWQETYCNEPKPLYADPTQACLSVKQELEEEGRLENVGAEIDCPSDAEDPRFSDGKNCTGFCDSASLKTPCSCGMMTCPGCLLGLGYDGMTDDSFLPEGCMFMGCTEALDPMHPSRFFFPMIIPGGFNIRTCPVNVMDGMRPWTTIAQQTTSFCEINEACLDEPHNATMILSGHRITFCCPGETSDPFSALSLGYFGVKPEKAHYNEKEGAICDRKGCTYRPSCACPLSVPAFNIRVTGPSRRFDPIFIPAESAYSESENLASADAKIVIAPHLSGESKYTTYAVSFGSDDSLHVGDKVSLNPPNIFMFIEKYKDTSCHDRWKLEAITLDYYPGYGGPKEINPSGKWDVRAPPASLFDDRKIYLAPNLTDGTLDMGPVFVGHPGKTYVGKVPDVRGIFKGLENRPTSGPGSTPGGTTNDGIEKLKAFFQCKDDMTSATEWDLRIWYKK